MPCGFEGEEGSWLANFTNNNLEWFEQYGVRYAEGFQNYLTEVIKTFPGKIKEMETELSRLEKIGRASCRDRVCVERGGRVSCNDNISCAMETSWTAEDR